MRTKFDHDIRMILALRRGMQQDLYHFYEAARSGEGRKGVVIRRFLAQMGLQEQSGAAMAAATRMVALRDDALVRVAKNAGWDDERIVRLKEESYLWVADYYLSRFEKFCAQIEHLELLSPFYRAVIRGAHEVGRAMSRANTAWTAQVVHSVNPMLSRLFAGDEAKILEHLRAEELLDRHEGEVAERCYSVLVPQGDGRFCALSYAEAFAQEVGEVVAALNSFLSQIQMLEDEVLGEAEAWRSYIRALIDAFSQTERSKLLGCWQAVDTAWMQITGPIQIGHPLEYYEDHYRRAVALEWDVRIDDPDATWANVYNQMPAWYATQCALYHEAPLEIVTASQANLARVQLHIGVPLLFYGAQFCGLFSAQVVPNDETVSAAWGKKIFTYASTILENERAKPFFRLHEEVFEAPFLERYRRLLFWEEGLWYQVYDASTIGHECGHILWMDDKSELAMNRTGRFKNIEEFKATTSGLVAAMGEAEDDFLDALLTDHIRRCVGLIAWRESGEAQPYYVEALIHLTIMFGVGMLSFDGHKLQVFPANARAVKEAYAIFYEQMVRDYYLKRTDPAPLLERMVVKEGESYLPVDENVRAFVCYYWALYETMGQETLAAEFKQAWLTGAQ